MRGRRGHKSLPGRNFGFRQSFRQSCGCEDGAPLRPGFISRLDDDGTLASALETRAVCRLVIKGSRTSKSFFLSRRSRQVESSCARPANDSAFPDQVIPPLFPHRKPLLGPNRTSSSTFPALLARRLSLQASVMRPLPRVLAASWVIPPIHELSDCPALRFVVSFHGNAPIKMRYSSENSYNQSSRTRSGSKDPTLT